MLHSGYFEQFGLAALIICQNDDDDPDNLLKRGEIALDRNRARGCQ